MYVEIRELGPMRASQVFTAPNGLQVDVWQLHTCPEQTITLCQFLYAYESDLVYAGVLNRDNNFIGDTGTLRQHVLSISVSLNLITIFRGRHCRAPARCLPSKTGS